jgi:hypothetical protein
MNSGRVCRDGAAAKLRQARRPGGTRQAAGRGRIPRRKWQRTGFADPGSARGARPSRHAGASHLQNGLGDGPRRTGRPTRARFRPDRVHAGRPRFDAQHWGPADGDRLVTMTHVSPALAGPPCARSFLPRQETTPQDRSGHRCRLCEIPRSREGPEDRPARLSLQTDSPAPATVAARRHARGRSSRLPPRVFLSRRQSSARAPSCPRRGPP